MSSTEKYIYFFVRKVDNGKFPQLQNTELLTPDTAKTKKRQNTAGITLNILSESPQNVDSNEENEGKKKGKDSGDNEVNNGIGECENRSHEDILAIEKMAFENFGYELDEKGNKSLESKSCIKIEMNQLNYGPIVDASGDAGDLIAKDMLCFACQIARGMVSDKQLVLFGVI